MQEVVFLALKPQVISNTSFSADVQSYTSALQVARARTDSLEGEHAERTVRLVARVVDHPFAPEVVGEDAAQAGAGPDVWIVQDGPYIVVHELPP